MLKPRDKHDANKRYEPKKGEFSPAKGWLCSTGRRERERATNDPEDELDDKACAYIHDAT